MSKEKLFYNSFFQQKSFFFWGSCLFLLVAVYWWPIDFLHVTNFDQPNEVVFTTPAPLGTTLHTRMVHSVQKTPVEDIYRLLYGGIYAWQEWVQSHNAGLPSIRPKYARFTYDPPWMILEGGHQYFSHIIYRVGTVELGKNQCLATLPWCFSKASLWYNLYVSYPGQRLFFTLTLRPVYQGKVIK